MKIFLDSSILIEFEKETNTDLLEELLASPHQLYINPIVFSEYVYQLLGILGGRSPMSICESGKIGEVLSQHDTSTFISAFQILPIPQDALSLSLGFMKLYNLLPNDAIILASCKLLGIQELASYDSDFSEACQAEQIHLISKVSDLTA